MGRFFQALVNLQGGNMAATPQEKADMWFDEFVDEFGARTVVSEYVADEGDIPTCEAGDNFVHVHPWTAMEWEVALAQAVSSMPKGEAVGPDPLPIEFIRAGGGRCIHLLASALKKMVDRGRQRSGETVPVKKKASKPLTTVNSRGASGPSHCESLRESRPCPVG